MWDYRAFDNVSLGIRNSGTVLDCASNQEHEYWDIQDLHQLIFKSDERINTFVTLSFPQKYNNLRYITFGQTLSEMWQSLFAISGSIHGS